MLRQKRWLKVRSDFVSAGGVHQIPATVESQGNHSLVIVIDLAAAEDTDIPGRFSLPHTHRVGRAVRSTGAARLFGYEHEYEMNGVHDLRAVHRFQPSVA